MNEKKYLLTISIMASNRKDTLPKTLESIKPLLDNVSSELIVTDTGCDEDVLAVIRNYTDKIVKFQWCKDFAKARNVGLSMAQGQWFMYLDDDEWFENVSELIEFFNSEESKKYKAFDYMQRNYKDLEGSEWMDTPVSRATRIDDGIIFEDKIHEHFSKALEPAKLVNVYVHHYGYIYPTKEDKLKHARRNLELLEAQLEEGNHSLRQYHHMLQEYNLLEQHDNSYRMALQGISKSKENNENIPRFLSGLKVNVVSALLNMNRNEEAIKYAVSYLTEGGLTNVACCAMHGYLAHAFYNMSMVNKTIEAVKEYLEMYSSLKLDEIQIAYDSTLTSVVAFAKVMPNMLFNIGLRCAVQEKHEEDIMCIMKYTKCIDGFEPVDDGVWLQELVELMRQSVHKDEYVETIIVYMDNLVCATKICSKLLDIKEESEEEFMRVTEKLISVDKDNAHLKLLKTIYYGLKGEVDKLR